VRRLRELFQRLTSTKPAEADSQDLIEKAAQTRALYRDSLDDDLNLPRGLGYVFDFVREVNAALDGGEVNAHAVTVALGVLADADVHLDVLGETAQLDEEIEDLIAEREEARRARDFARSDRIREDLRRRGIVLEDSKDGVRWRKVALTEGGRS
jgi:cysteinyl-tRNA synthetase